jgi:hypothetical protein
MGCVGCWYVLSDRKIAVTTAWDVSCCRLAIGTELWVIARDQEGAPLRQDLWPQGWRWRLGARRHALARALKFDFTHGKFLLGQYWTLVDK